MKKNHTSLQTTEIAVELTKTLVAIDSSQKNGVLETREVLSQWAKSHNLAVTRVPKTRTLYIETNPKAEKEFSFVCHYDVVTGAGWKEAFKPVIKDGELYGRGSVDDKGPLAMCLAVMLEWQHDPKINLSCLVVSDEEIVNRDIRRILEQKFYHPNFCLVVDGGEHHLFDIGQKGMISLSLSLTTSGGHSAFEEAEKSASLQLLKFIHELEKYAATLETDSHFQPTFINVSKFITETVPYGLPTVATANLEIQFPPPQTLDQWLQKIKAVQKTIPRLKIKQGFTEVPHLVTDEKVLNIIRQQPRAQLITVGGVNLSKDLNKAGVVAVGHCPVAEYMGHCDDERIKLSDFSRGIKQYNQLVKRWKKR